MTDEDRGGSLIGRLAVAPISWGICEVPGWGMQLPVKRVLSEMHDLGVTATELGADGWLPTDVDELRRVLAEHDLTLTGAFVPLEAHDPARVAATLATAEAVAHRLAAAGARYFVTAMVSDVDDWTRVELDDDGWATMLSTLARVEEITASHGLTHLVHPHVNTLVETASEITRLLASSDLEVCLDTGHFTIGGVDVVAFARDHVDRVALVHLKDVRLPVAARLTSRELSLMEAVQAGLFAPLGAGDVPVDDVITTLEHGGYSGTYVLEQDAALTGEPPPFGEGPVRDVAASVAYLRELDATIQVAARLRSAN